MSGTDKRFDFFCTHNNIVIKLSKSLLVTTPQFNAVQHWNGLGNQMLYFPHTQTLHYTVDSSTWDSFLTNQNDILRQARAENPRTASTYESIDEYQEKAMLSTQMQSLAQKSSSLDRYQKHPMQQLPPPAVPDRRHSREESPYTTMGSAPSTLQNQQKLDLKNQGSPQHPSIYPSLDTEVVPNNDETRVSGGSAGYFSSASGGDDVNAYDHITPMDPLAEQSKQDIPGESFMGSQDEGHFVQTEC